MNEFVDKESLFPWSIISSTGNVQSTTLPVVVRTFEEFIKVDIYSGDSDPVYWALYRSMTHSEFGWEWTTRFAVAMLAYYHMGTALKAADQKNNEFWPFLKAIYPAAPRGSERRHFRGEKGLQALERMEAHSPNPIQFFSRLPSTYKDIKEYCAYNLTEFGPYFVLKTVDYMDRCMRNQVGGMDALADNLPNEPAKAIKLIYPGLSVAQGFRRMCGRVSLLGLRAAPDFGRPVGPAEVETSLCGWKTTKYKGNWFGADIASKREELSSCGARGQLLASLLPPPVKRDTFRCEL
jgi:hypothetical protein